MANKIIHCPKCKERKDWPHDSPMVSMSALDGTGSCWRCPDCGYEADEKELAGKAFMIDNPNQQGLLEDESEEEDSDEFHG
ncbi:MAG: hypothetical protein ACTSRU_19390 [Candidatus Hodarchaeales archaeon]